MTTPAQPADADADAQSAAEAIALELAARDLYDMALEAGADEPVWETLREQHESYAQRLAGLVGQSADAADAGVVGDLEGSFSGNDLWTAAVELENMLAAEHTTRLTEVSGDQMATALASIITAEARQATVLAMLSGETDPEVLYVNPNNEAGA